MVFITITQIIKFDHSDVLCNICSFASLNQSCIQIFKLHQLNINNKWCQIIIFLLLKLLNYIYVHTYSGNVNSYFFLKKVMKVLHTQYKALFPRVPCSMLTPHLCAWPPAAGGLPVDWLLTMWHLASWIMWVGHSVKWWKLTFFFNLLIQLLYISVITD